MQGATPVLSAAAAALQETAITRLATKTAKVGVIGLGYVGLPLSLLFTEEGFDVTGFDIDAKKVKILDSGNSYICRIPPTEIQLAATRGFKATSDYSHIAALDAVVICVPTPLDEYRQPDLSFITTTVKSIAPHIHAGQLIVLESTTYPGTTEEVVVPLLEKENPCGLQVSRGQDDSENVFFVAFSPEREDPGNNTVARRDIPKVVGGIDAFATAIAAQLYRSIFRNVVQVSSPAVAEMTKLLENIYRCVNIALVNELKLLCLRLGIDIWEVIGAAKTKPFGFQAFYPGPGLGGHCIPIDPFYLSWKARECDFATRFIELAGEINTTMPYHVVDQITNALNSRNKPLKGAKVLVLGVAYKKDIDDMRESPAITIIELLKQRGAVVDYHDPYFPEIGRGRKYNLDMRRVSLDDVPDYDCVAVVTDHSDYDYAAIASQAQLLVDTRNATSGLKLPNIVRC